MKTCCRRPGIYFKNLVKSAKNTVFGKDHNFDKIETYEDFKQAVPIRDYEQLKPYIEKIKEGTQNVYGKESQFILPKQVEQPVG